MRFRIQPKRGGVRGQPWCCLGLAATGRPLVLSREWERTAPLARATGKENPRHQAQPKAHQPAHIEGGPPVPPASQRMTDITPKVAPSRPREEANSLAPHEVLPSSQAARGPGAAMVLSQIGCPRAPFGSFPRVGKNTPPARRAKEPCTHQAQPKAHHLARNEGGPPVPPGRQRMTDITPKIAPSRPREEAISHAQQEVSPPSQAARGPGAAMVLSQIGCPRAPFGSFPRVGKNTPPARRAKEPCTHQAQPKAHHLARNEGGPPVPPGRQRMTDITPKIAPSRPREEGISLAPHEAPPPSQARRGPGAAMVLSRIGCHRAPFGSFPRVGKNSPPHSPMCKGTPHKQEEIRPCPRNGHKNPALRKKEAALACATGKPKAGTIVRPG